MEHGINQNIGENLCLADEKCGGARLQTPAEAEADSEAGSFDFEIGDGNILAIGGPHDLLYVGGHSRVQEFEANGQHELCGEVNPNGVYTRGFFKYGVSESALEHETATMFLGEGSTFVPMGFELTGLMPNQQYYDQAWVEAESGGVEQRQSAPEIVSFRTEGPPPQIPGQPVVSFVTEQSAVLSASLNPSPG